MGMMSLVIGIYGRTHCNCSVPQVEISWALRAASRICTLKPVSLSNQGRSFLSFGFRSMPARSLRVSCVAKPETVEKVCEIVKKQLALAEGTPVNGESKFSTLGADSLDTILVEN